MGFLKKIFKPGDKNLQESSSGLAFKKASSSGASSLSGEGDLKSLQFLSNQPICNLASIGVFNNWGITISPNHLVFSLLKKVIIFNLVRKTIKEIDYGFEAQSWEHIRHNLSPNGSILVRWRRHRDNDPWIITALSTRTHQTIAELQSSFQCEPLDTTNTKWIDDWTVFIPISRQGIVIRWTFHGDNAVPNEPLIIQPIEAVAHHYLLRYDGTEDGAWWTVTGISWGGGPPSGAIEVRDVVNAESRIVEGMASCIAEVEVYDRKKALLISVNLGSGAKLQLSVQQVNPTEPGQPFIPVETEVDFLNQNDFPTVVYVLHPLPIVAVVTSEQYIYFFELHTGAHLYAFDPNPCETWWRQSDPRGVLIWKNAQRTIHRVSVNERDLIRYCRLVLKDDILASGIAIRTGLSGAEDVAFHEMHNYQTSS